MNTDFTNLKEFKLHCITLLCLASFSISHSTSDLYHPLNLWLINPMLISFYSDFPVNDASSTAIGSMQIRRGSTSLGKLLTMIEKTSFSPAALVT